VSTKKRGRKPKSATLPTPAADSTTNAVLPAEIVKDKVCMDSGNRIASLSSKVEPNVEVKGDREEEEFVNPGMLQHY